jgi:hypothetical protein
MDYEKTAVLYKEIGQSKKFEQTPEFYCYEAEKKWYEQVKSKRTGDFFQAEDLIKREMVPSGWTPPHVDAEGKPLQYPVKYVNSIIRVRALDSSEWIKTRQMWWGLDQAGNPLNISMNDKETYDNILPIYQLKPERPNDRDSRMIREIKNIEKRIKYTEPFKPETAQKLYDMRNGKCFLSIKDEVNDSPPYEVKSLNDFMNRPFEELFDYLSTPIQRVEPSTPQGNLKQYG